MRLARRIAFGVIVVGCLLYIGDDLAARLRIPGNRDPLGTVHVDRYYVIPEKNNKIQFLPADPETVTCVHALFPHFGYNPCWYESRTTRKQIEM
jgi:hypothetical protein